MRKIKGYTGGVIFILLGLVFLLNGSVKASGEVYHTYFGQIHSHTTNSDGYGTVEEAFAYGSKVPGLDFLAITDHSNALEEVAGTANISDGSTSKKWLYGLEQADKITESTKGRFIGIYGYEMTWSNGVGHMNTYNTSGFENRNTPIYKTAQGLEAYYQKLKSQPRSISQFNHPGDTFGDFEDFSCYDKEIDQRITMIEVANGEGPVRGKGYFPSYEYYNEALDKGWHVAPTIGQDNHQGKWGDANTARTVILADTLSRDKIYDAMENRRIYATEDENLKIVYRLNDNIMGSILEKEPKKVTISLSIEDPDKEKIGTLQVIAEGGKSIYQKEITSSKEQLNFPVPAEHSYYYIRIQQPDKDIAVTAPVWIREVSKWGIEKCSLKDNFPIKGKPFSIGVELFNQEDVDIPINSMEFYVGKKIIHKVNIKKSGFTKIPSKGTLSYEFSYTQKKEGTSEIKVKLEGEYQGKKRVFWSTLPITVYKPNQIRKVIIDGGHRGDYVNGYYNGNMTNFMKLGVKNQVQVVVEEDITPEKLENTDLLVITAPLKKEMTVEGTIWTPKVFDKEFLEMVKKYVDDGGNLCVCGTADYQDNKNNGKYATDNGYQSSTQINNLLSIVGATTRINNDQVMDQERNGGQPYRLRFTNFNVQSGSPFLKRLLEGQEYSFYSGCSVLLDEKTVNAGDASWLVKGHTNTFSQDTTGTLKAELVKQGEVCALAKETLPGGGFALIGGTVFLSNFEIQGDEVDNYSDVYANYTITENIFSQLAK